MAELASSASPSAVAWLTKDRSYLWRRLHSLTGILPVGLFLLFHLFENMAAIDGAKAYDHGVSNLASLLPAPYFYLVEVFLILTPILFHGLYGFILVLDGKAILGANAYRRNFSYLLQRATGLVAMVYLVYHVVALRLMVTLFGRGGGVEGHDGYVNFGNLVQHFDNPAVVGFYVVGVLSCAYHFCNGLNGLCWTWGLAVGERSRKIVELLSLALFAVISLPFLHILWSFWSQSHG